METLKRLTVEYYFNWSKLLIIFVLLNDKNQIKQQIFPKWKNY